MDWFLLCPLCACVIDSFRKLRNLNSHCHCNLCHVDFDAALDDQIAVGFTVSPDIRGIAYHDPQKLPVEDYSFRYRSANEGLIPDETPFTVVKQMITKALAYIEPDEKTTLDVEAEARNFREPLSNLASLNCGNLTVQLQQRVRSFGIRRPNPHSVATPKWGTTPRAAASLRFAPAIPSV